MSKYTVSEKIGMEQLLKESADFQVPKAGQLIDGIVIKKEKSQILVDIGGQTTGVIAGKEIQDSMGTAVNIEVGTQVSVMVIEDDSEDGSLILSIRKASQFNNWDRFEKLKKSGEIISVVPTQANKGGLIVDVDGVKAFIPVSQLAPEHYPRVENSDSGKILTKLNEIVGKKVKVVVLNVEKSTGKIIFSEKAARKGDLEKEMKKLEIGSTVKGTITGVSRFGFFITFAGLEGLVHISEIAWGHVKDPNEFGKNGDVLDLKVIGIDNGKVSLSLKQMKQDPWMEIAGNYKIGQDITGTVSKVTDFGAFVSLGGGVNGLIHVSEMEKGGKNLKVGEEITSRIIDINTKEHRVGLSIKEEKKEEEKVEEAKKSEEKEEKA
ncbi:S1 RNA-binding domain-containing protein [Candidatus Gracilibacteria bacterium]|nr:S1 RNA-binding domain-containing protein [Candidatus Gracilibacteria bacterium]